MAINTHREHSLDAIATAEGCLHNDGETLTVLLDHADNRACACMPRERAGGSKGCAWRRRHPTRASRRMRC